MRLQLLYQLKRKRMYPLLVRMNSFYAVSCNPSAFTVKLQDDVAVFFLTGVFLLLTYPLLALELRLSRLHCLTILLVLPRSVSCLVNGILLVQRFPGFNLSACVLSVFIYPGLYCLNCLALTSLLLLLLLLRKLIVFIQLEFCVIQMSFIITLVLVVSRSLIFKL